VVSFRKPKEMREQLLPLAPPSGRPALVIARSHAAAQSFLALGHLPADHPRRVWLCPSTPGQFQKSAANATRSSVALAPAPVQTNSIKHAEGCAATPYHRRSPIERDGTTGASGSDVGSFSTSFSQPRTPRARAFRVHEGLRAGGACDG
jgi:hypothetical protein